MIRAKRKTLRSNLAQINPIYKTTQLDEKPDLKSSGFLLEISSMKAIVIGAGAAGLMAAYELTRKGADVIILEADNRIGGRIHTLIPSGFTQPIEAGAEFIHGHLPLTLALMEQAKMPYVEASMAMTEFKNGSFTAAFNSEHWERFEKIVSLLKRDCTLNELLDRHFRGPVFKDFRMQCQQMAQGLDLADPDKLSVFCIREEWTSSESQYRTVSGYGPLLDFLAHQIIINGGQILLNHRVSKITWDKGNVAVKVGSDIFKADSVIVTTTLGNLQQRQIAFKPKIDDSLFEVIGFGNVLKIVMEFENAFWEKSHPDLGFLFTDNDYTFWTQLELRRPVLMGWIGNDKASDLGALPDSEIIAQLLYKLGEAFPESQVQKVLKASVVFRYTPDQPTSGGYSWTMPQSLKAIRKINEGIENTLWFAGEAFERTGNVATVEAAFQSGRYSARKVLRSNLLD